jgi:hypothetical protein
MSETSYALAIKDELAVDMRRPTTRADRVPITATDTETTPLVSGLKWRLGRKRATSIAIMAPPNRIAMMIALIDTEFMAWPPHLFPEAGIVLHGQLSAPFFHDNVRLLPHRQRVNVAGEAQFSIR